MSILINGMEMPKSCYFCPLTNDGFYLCKANNPYKYLEDDCEERRPDWCPLVPVPPHGKLIDADALRAEFQEPNEENGGWRNPDEALVHKTGVWAAIDAAPTIIPAEEASDA